MRSRCAVAVSFLVVWGFLQVLCDNEGAHFEAIKPLLENKVFMDRVLNCIKDDNSCSRVGRDIKDKARTAYISRCKNCTEQERSMAKKFFVFLNGTGQWDTLMKAFDPEDTYRKDFETFLVT